MPDANVKGISVKIGGDTKGLDNALRTAENTAKKTTAELRNIDKALKNAPENAVLWNQKQTVLNKALEESKEKLRILEQAQEQVNKQFEKGDISAEQYRAFERELLNAESAVRRVEEQIENTESAIENLGKSGEENLNEIQEEVRETSTDFQEMQEEIKSSADELQELGEKGERLQGIGERIEGIGTKLAPVTVGVTALGTAAIKTGSDFDSSISKVAATSNATAQEVEQLREKAREMGAATKFSASEAADGFNYMAMAGWKTKEMVSGIDGILDLAAASGEGLATTSDIVTDALTAFGLTAADSSHFADVLAAASSNANTNVSMMGETFKYAAPVAGALGFSVEDTAEAIGLMANSGIKASQAGTSLRSIMTILSGNLTVSGKAIGEVNIATQDAGGNMRDLSDILADLRANFSQLTEAEAAQNAEEIAGKEAMSGFLALMNAAPADVDKLSSAIENSTGKAKEMATVMQDNLEGDLSITKSMLEELAISASDTLMPAVRPIISELQSIIDWLNKLDPKQKELLVKTGLLAASLSPVLITLGKTTSAIGSLYSAAAKAPSALSSIAGGLSSLTGLSSALSLGIVGVAGALVVGGGSLLYAAHKAKEAHLEQIFEDTVKPARDAKEATEAEIQALNNMKEAATNQAVADLALIDNTNRLYKELQTLVDENGKVKEGYENRVSYILNELYDATEVEAEVIDGEIANYQELCSEIEKTMSLQRAYVMQDAYKETYNQAVINNSSMFKRMGSDKQQIDEAKDYINQIEREVLSELREAGDWTEIKSIGLLTPSNLDKWRDELRDEEYAKIDGLFAAIEEWKADLESLETEYNETQYIIDTYEKGQQATFEGDSEAAQRLFSSLDDLGNAEITNFNKRKEERLQIVEDEAKQAIYTYQQAVQHGDDNAESDFAVTMQNIADKAKEGGITSGDLISSGIIEKLAKIDDDFNYDDLVALFGGVGDIGGANLVQNFTPHLSNLKTAISGTFDNVKAALSNVEQRISSLKITVPKANISKQATGGILNYGTSMIAEAGPELLTIAENGGVQVTPLTSEAKNSVIKNTENQGDTYYNTFNVVVEKVNNDIDIDRIAERMADKLEKAKRGGRS